MVVVGDNAVVAVLFAILIEGNGVPDLEKKITGLSIINKHFKNRKLNYHSNNCNKCRIPAGNHPFPY